MIRRAACALAVLWAAMPLTADTLDDATCGVIGEYALDLAYDAGVSAALAPDGTTGSDETGCFMTGLVLSPDSRSGLRIGYIGWSGEGLEDWVAGHGLPRSVNVTVEGAYLQTRLPDHPAYAWALDLTNRRNVASATFNARWDPKAGRLSIDQLQVRNPSNALSLSGVLTGLSPEPSLMNIQQVALHALDVRIDMAGVFETLILTPLVAGTMSGEKDPEAAFAAYVEMVRGYIDVLPNPQVDDETRSALNRFLTSLPSPTGRLSLKIDGADEGLRMSAANLLVLVPPNAPPERIGRLIGSFMGESTLRVGWQPADPE